MKIRSIVNTGILLLAFIVNSYVFSQGIDNNIKNPIEYFNNRTEAISLAKSEKWQEAIPILERLTQAYQKDGDVFYLLGLSYYQLQQYPNAINALKKKP